MRWNETDHPRDPDGRFRDGWAGRVSDAIGRRFGVAADPSEFQADYAPGQWKVETRETRLKAAEVETWALINGPDMAQLREDHTPDQLASMVRDQAEMLVPPGDSSKVLRNGPHKVFLSNGLVHATDEDAEAIARRVDELHAGSPVNGPISVSVVPQGSLADGNTRGMTQRGTGRIFLSDLIFAPDAQKEGDAGFMPSYNSAGVVDYTITHEWGHAIDHLGNPESMEAWGNGMDGASDYGLGSWREAYAEAYAEWTLTGGQTANASARAYAERFGWK